MRPLQIQGHTRPLTQVSFNADGDLLFTSGRDGLLNVFRVRDAALIGQYEGHGGAVGAFDVTLDSKYIVSAAWDGGVRVFDVLSGELLAESVGNGMIRSVEWCQNPHDSLKFVSIKDRFKDDPMKITVWRFRPYASSEEDRLEVVQDIILGTEGVVKNLSVRWGLFDRTIIGGDENGFVQVYDAETGELQLRFQAHAQQVNKLQFNVDRTLCVTCSADMTAKLWDVTEVVEEEGKEPSWRLLRVYKSDRPINDAHLSPLYNVKGDSRRQHLLLGGGQAARDVTTTKGAEGKFEACLFHAVYEEELGKIPGHFGPINTLTWAPNGKGFVSGGEDGFVRMNWFDSDYAEGAWNE